MKCTRQLTEALGRLAKQGIDWAQYDYALLLNPFLGDFPEPTPYEEASAIEWLRTAAEKGHAPAQYAWGVHLASQNRELAMQWIRAAAEKGVAEAPGTLVKYYLKQETCDWNEVMDWIKRAVDNGDTRAAPILGHCLAEGFLVEKNLSQALELCKWGLTEPREEPFKQVRQIYMDMNMTEE